MRTSINFSELLLFDTDLLLALRNAARIDCVAIKAKHGISYVRYAFSSKKN